MKFPPLCSVRTGTMSSVPGLPAQALGGQEGVARDPADRLGVVAGIEIDVVLRHHAGPEEDRGVQDSVAPSSPGLAGIWPRFGSARSGPNVPVSREANLASHRSVTPEPLSPKAASPPQPPVPPGVPPVSPSVTPSTSTSVSDLDLDLGVRNCCMRESVFLNAVRTGRALRARFLRTTQQPRHPSIAKRIGQFLTPSPVSTVS